MGSSPFLCLDLAKRNLVRSVTCQEIIAEFQEKLQVKFNYPYELAKAACDDLKSYSQLVSISNTLKVVSQDPDDDMVLECAIVGFAKYIVTGDRHLLSLGNYRNIQIVKARDFLAIAFG